MQINVDGNVMSNEKTFKLLEIIVDNQLSFYRHLSKIYKKVSQKLHALARISSYILENKNYYDSIFKVEISYCHFVSSFYSRTMNNQINKFQERAKRPVNNYRQSTFEELFDKNKSCSIHHRDRRVAVTEMYKVYSEIFEKKCN